MAPGNSTRSWRGMGRHLRLALNCVKEKSTTYGLTPFPSGCRNRPETLGRWDDRTTYPPIQLSGSASADVTLSPVVIRDRDDVTIADDVDLGYHYPAVDYALQNYTVSGWDVTVTPGTALIGVSDTGLRVSEGSL